MQLIVKDTIYEQPIAFKAIIQEEVIAYCTKTDNPILEYRKIK